MNKTDMLILFGSAGTENKIRFGEKKDTIDLMPNRHKYTINYYELHFDKKMYVAKK